MRLISIVEKKVIVSDPRFKDAVISTQGEAGFTVVVEIAEFLDTDQSMRWFGEVSRLSGGLSDAQRHATDKRGEPTRQQAPTPRSHEGSNGAA